MAQKKNPIVKKKNTQENKPIVFPIHKNKIYYIFAAFAFLFPFLIYILTLAPTVTLEDSGELVSAAYFLGVPHEPGYPLFVLFGKIFTLLPFGTIAYRVNLMSAFFSALACVFLFKAMVLIIEETFIKTKFWFGLHEKNQQYLNYSIAFTAAILWAFAFKTWEQSIITEVYGINNFFIALFIFIFLKWRRESDEIKKKKIFYLLCFITGLAITTHTTATMLIAVTGAYILLQERKLLLNIKLLGKAIASFFAGLLPWIFLLFASMTNPPVDWGNPENFTNLIRVITRHQYQAQDIPTNLGGSEVFGFFFKSLLPEQWYFFFLLFIPFGLYIIFKNNRSFFYFLVFFLIMAIPVLSYITRDFLTNDENKALVSVFYIPAYMLLSISIAAGMCFLISIVKNISKFIIPLCLFLILLSFTSIPRNYKNLNMHEYRFAEDYANNLFTNLPKNALYFVNWDPFSFPMTYFQFVEKKRQDILVIDQLLLKRSWYIHWLRTYYPEIMKLSEKEINGFLTAVAPFEAGEKYDGNYIQQNYIAMINSIIDNKINTGNGVYFAYLPEKDIIRNNFLEPQFVAYKYNKTTAPDLTLTDKNCNVKSFLDKNITKDRMAKYMAEYYGELYGTRASYMEQVGQPEKAIEYYSKSIPLFDYNSPKAKFSAQRLSFLRSRQK